MRRAKSSRVFGPMSRPSQPSGRAANGLTWVSASSENADAATHVLREDRVEREGVLAADVLGHLPADQDLVGAAAQVLEHRDLVLDLGASRDDHERTLDVSERALRGA